MAKLHEHPLAMILLSAVAFVFMFSLYIATKAGLGDGDPLTILQQSVQRQQARVDELEQQVILTQDPFVQERIQRDERLLQQPGEIVLQVPPLEIAPSTPAPTPTPLTPWQEWRALLW